MDVIRIEGGGRTKSGRHKRTRYVPSLMVLTVANVEESCKRKIPKLKSSRGGHKSGARVEHDVMSCETEVMCSMDDLGLL